MDPLQFVEGALAPLLEWRVFFDVCLNGGWG